MTETEDQHLEVLEAAFHIFESRNNVRGDLWAESPIDKQLEMAQEKIKRIIRNYHGLEEPIDVEVAIDDGLDAINFLAFAVRIMTGKVPNASANKN